MCLCEETRHDSHRYFSLQEAAADVHNNKYIHQVLFLGRSVGLLKGSTLRLRVHRGYPKVTVYFQGGLVVEMEPPSLFLLLLFVRGGAAAQRTLLQHARGVVRRIKEQVSSCRSVVRVTLGCH